MTTSPFGSWLSPITADRVAAASVRLSDLQVCGDTAYYIEGRPAEGGRQTVVRAWADGSERTDCIPGPFNVRTRVHEYGGGSSLVHRDTVYFTNYRDQGIYRGHMRGGEPTLLFQENGLRYADYAASEESELLFAVEEDHRNGETRVENRIVAFSLNGSGRVAVAEGYDFYSNPRPSPCGRKLCWLQWNHPEMPWDGCELIVAEMDPHGAMTSQVLVAGGTDESIFQPEWGPDGLLYFVSDRSGWWNLYRYDGEHVSPLLPMEAEFGLPQWVFRQSTYAFAAHGRLVFSYQQDGRSHLGVLDLNSGAARMIESEWSQLGSICASGNFAWALAGSATRPSSLVRFDLDSGDAVVVAASADLSDLGSEYLSAPAAIRFETTNGRMAHALYYAPRNPDFTPRAGELPPLLVKAHGGPTGAANSSLSLAIQYWTSRGVAVVDVNYGGSTGYGREYRNRLRDNWGIVDVDDCVHAAQHLVSRGLADPKRLAISGGSAGGFTTLNALTFRKVFGAGASYYGVSDLAGLANDTHKFESRYLDRLVGPYPERADLYDERSALKHAELIEVPVAFFQGAEDAVVIPEQTESMVNALRARGVPVFYLLFEGEQHGFRKAANIRRALEAEMEFYSTVLFHVGLQA